MKKHLTLINFVFLSSFASFLNYATYPLLARALPDIQFVNITVALSLLTQVSSFLSSIVAVTIGLTKRSRNGTPAVTTIEKLQRSIMWVFVGVIVVFTLTSPLFLHQLQLPRVLLFPIGLLLVFSIPISVISGFLSGKQKLVKLGFVAVISAALQFALSITVGFITQNGALALVAMSAGQFIAVGILYTLYKSENMPRLSSLFLIEKKVNATERLHKLVIFTVLASFGIMAINIVQILDLLIIKSQGVDAKFYTDIYIISRFVFFAGTIFIWPFLSSVEVYDRASNVWKFIKLMLLFTLISATFMGGVLLFGKDIIHILFGSDYASSAINTASALSILYKYIFLLIMAFTLFFIVIRSYFAIALPTITSIALGTFVLFLKQSASTTQTLIGLNVVSGFCLIIGAVFFFVSLRTGKS